MSRDALLLAPDTRVTCPGCEQEFSLEQGFAKQALETLAASSTSALGALREHERVAAERRARQTADEQARAAQRQVQDLQRLLQEQGEAHTRALAEMRALTEQSFKPQLAAVREELAASRAQLSAMDQREAALALREQSIEARVQEAATQRAAQLLAAERQGYEQRWRTATPS